jgi:hypothetical protein
LTLSSFFNADFAHSANLQPPRNANSTNKTQKSAFNQINVELAFAELKVGIRPAGLGSGS